jgi:hypothetical protein
MTVQMIPLYMNTAMWYIGMILQVKALEYIVNIEPMSLWVRGVGLLE